MQAAESLYQGQMFPQCFPNVSSTSKRNNFICPMPLIVFSTPGKPATSFPPYDTVRDPQVQLSESKVLLPAEMRLLLENNQIYSCPYLLFGKSSSMPTPWSRACRFLGYLGSVVSGQKTSNQPPIHGCWQSRFLAFWFTGQIWVHFRPQSRWKPLETGCPCRIT